MNFFENLQKVSRPAKMKRQDKNIMRVTHTRSPPATFCPSQPSNREKITFDQIGLCYTSMDAEFHDNQLLIKTLGKKNQQFRRYLQLKSTFFERKTWKILNFDHNLLLN